MRTRCLSHLVASVCLLPPVMLAQASPPQPAQAAPPAVRTFQVNVRRVVVDVVVTDANGVPVPALDRSDFQIFEDGKLQQLRSFDAHVPHSQPQVPVPVLPPGTFSNLSHQPQSGSPTVILYDLLNTPLESQPYAREQLLHFLKQRRLSGQVAIFVLGDKLHLLQGFTDDEDQLIAALNSQAAGNAKSRLLASTAEASQQSDSVLHTAGNDSASQANQDVSYQQLVTMLQHMETMEQSFQTDRRVEITTDALEQIARFLVGLPGRKNLIWLSTAFPAGILPDPNLNARDSFQVTRSYSREVTEMSQMLEIGHVSVYPVDVRGLQANSMFSAASNQTFEPGLAKDTRAVRDFAQQNDSTHATMDAVAEDTGGHAFYNTNGLSQAVERAMQDGATYYTLSYSPDNHTAATTLRHIRVELAKPGYQLAYRRTYFASNPDQAIQSMQAEAIDPFAGTLQHAAPTARELFFEAHLQLSGTPQPATPAQMQVLKTYEAMSAPARPAKAKHPAAASTPQPAVQMQGYLITYGLLPRQLDLRPGPSGLRHSNLQVAVISYDADGRKLNGIRTDIRDTISPEQYDKLLANGYQVVQMFYAPVNAASLRLAVRDVNHGHLGSLEVKLPLPAEPRP